MTDNARHVPGSTRSRGLGLSRHLLPSLLSPVRSEKCHHYASKMRPNFKTQMLINSLPATYNFGLQKWSHFVATERFPLPWGERQGEGQTGSSFSGGSSHHPFSPGEKVRMRDRLVPRSWLLNPGDKLSNTVHNRQNRRARRFSTDSTTLYQPLTQIKIGVRQFSVGTSALRFFALLAAIPFPRQLAFITLRSLRGCASPRKSSKSANSPISTALYQVLTQIKIGVRRFFCPTISGKIGNFPEIRVSLEKPLY